MSALVLDCKGLTEAAKSHERSRILIRSASLLPAQNQLLGVLERLLPVNFLTAEEKEGDCLGEIIQGDKKSLPLRAVLQLPGPKAGTTRPGLAMGEVRFEDDPEVPFPFRARRLMTNIPADVEPLRLHDGEKLLASNQAGPIWAVLVDNGAKRFRSAFGLSEIGANGNFREVFSPENFLAMLPVIHFLRELAFEGGFPSPPLRACFIFDDPNLHWPAYGFVDFKEIAARALRENYHVSFATIPLDCWYANKRAVKIFRENAPHLSLLIHGNDHLYHELAGNYTNQARVALLQQVLQRIERFEQKTGLSVSRVMVPPHGACSEAMLAELPGCGFEAACISHGSLRAHNKDKAWTQALGLNVAEWIQGCPVLPRWSVTNNATNTVLLAAFLGQAIILRGHHEDLKTGLEVLDEPARLINSLGPVAWCGMAAISRMNYLIEPNGSDCRIQPFARRIEFQAPARASGFLLQNPCGVVSAWEVSRPDGSSVRTTGDCRIPLDRSASKLGIRMIPPPSPRMERLPRLPKPRAVVRRFLTEARDRVAVLR